MIAEITARSQITIPNEIINKIGIAVGDRLNISVHGKNIVLSPTSENSFKSEEERCAIVDGLIGSVDDTFTMEILKDLVAQGYSGNDLPEKFAEQRKKIREAIGTLINEADEIATGKRTSATTEELFGEA